MPTFAFTARGRSGATIRGRRTLPTEAALAAELASEGLFLLRSAPEAGARKSAARLRLSSKDLATFLLHLAAYVEVGLSLLDALRDFQDPRRPALNAVVHDMSMRITGGDTLSGAMEAYPRLFPAVHVSMVRSGETMGRLSESLRGVIRLLEWEESLRGQIREAATYPVVLLVLLALIGFAVAVFVLPPILELLVSFQIPLPLVTRVFLAMGTFLTRYGWVLGVLPLGVFAALKTALRNPGFRLRWDTFLLSLPLVGPMLLRFSLARFAHFLGEQYGAGVPLLQALRDSEGVTGNARMGHCVGILREGVERGERMAVMAARTGHFPQMIIRMLAIGEETGGLEKTLARAAQHFDAEAKAGVSLFFKILDPVTKVAMGCALIFVALALLLPIYSLSGGING